jgi:hypothetical protein
METKVPLPSHKRRCAALREVPIYIGKSPLGNGLFARTGIRRGSVICRLTGPIINFRDVCRKGKLASYPLQIGYDKYIDLRSPGCYANHSCKPNAGIRDGFNLVAIRNIHKCAEVCYDYSTTMDEDCYVLRCRCGARSCRQLVKDFRLLHPRIRQKYLKMGIVMPFICRKYERVCVTSRQVLPVNRNHVGRSRRRHPARANRPARLQPNTTSSPLI